MNYFPIGCKCGNKKFYLYKNFPMEDIVIVCSECKNEFKDFDKALK